MKLGMRFIRGLSIGWLGPRGDRFRCLCPPSCRRASPMPRPPARSWSRATGGSRPAPSAPISSPARTAGSGRCRSTRPTRRSSPPACSRTCASTPRAAASSSSVVENPVINRIAFEGNSKVKDEQLKLEIQSKERGTLSRAVVQSDVQRIVEVYRRTGRYDVSVDPKIIELPNNRVDLVFEINEGDKTNVKTIEFVGNKAYSSYRLKDVIKTSEDRPALVPAEQQHLRSRPARGGPRAAAPVLSQARLYRRPHRRGAGRIRSGAQADFVITFHDRGRRAVPRRHRRFVSNVRALDPALLRSRLRCRAGRRLQRRGGRKERRGHDDRGGAPGLCVRLGAAARRSRLPGAGASTSSSRSTKGSASTSSRSISAAIRARATT